MQICSWTHWSEINPKRSRIMVEGRIIVVERSLVEALSRLFEYDRALAESERERRTLQEQLAGSRQELSRLQSAERRAENGRRLVSRRRPSNSARYEGDRNQPRHQRMEGRGLKGAGSSRDEYDCEDTLAALPPAEGAQCQYSGSQPLDDLA
jgi:chromosome segregation ATPase